MLAAATGVVALSLPEEAAKPQFQLAATYAHRALALDPHDGEAYLGLIYGKSDFAHLPERFDLLAKGHAADPNNGVLALFFAEDLATVGRTQEGAPFAERAIELDPFNQWAAATLLRYRGYGGDIDGAKSVFATASQRWPHDPSVAIAAFGVAARVGDPAAAAAMLDDPHHDLDMPPDRVAIWRAFLRARQTRAAADVDGFIKLADARSGPQNPDQWITTATSYVILGRTDLAFAALDRIGKAAPENTYLLFLDVMAPLRADPRFIAVAARLGLVSIWRRTNRWPDFCSAPGLPYSCQGVAAKLAI